MFFVCFVVVLFFQNKATKLQMKCKNKLSLFCSQVSANHLQIPRVTGALMSGTKTFLEVQNLLMILTCF